MKFFSRLFPLTLLLFLIFCGNIKAGSLSFARDSSKTKAIQDSFHYSYFTGELYRLNPQKDPYTLKKFEVYHNHNFLGNIGQAETEYYAMQPLTHTGFNYFQNDFSKNLISSDSVRYFDTKHPYTKLFFLAGQKREAEFSFTHSQNVNKNLNFTAYFYRIRSDGTYLHQATNLTSIYLSSNYKSPNKRYFLLGNIIYNADKPQVNGGIKADSSLESQYQPTDKKLIPVNLMDAQRRYRNRSIFLKQFFNLGYKVAPEDSTAKPTFFPTSAFTINLGASDEAITYADDTLDARFYQQSYSHNFLTHDSVYLYRIKSAIGWNTWEAKRGGGKRKIGLFLGAENEIVRINQALGDTALMNFTIKGGLFNYQDTASSYRLKINAEYVVSGYNLGDYYANLQTKKAVLHKLLWVGVNATASLKKPDYMTMEYSSNNFLWRNHFSQVGANEGIAFLSIPKYFFEVGAFLRVYDHQVYYNPQAIPMQLNSACSVSGAYIYKELNLGRRWCFTNKVTYQNSSNEGVLQFPQWVTDHSLYFHHSIKNIMFYQIGIDVFYYSSYYGPSYMPATGQFYSQLDKKTGDYPFGDLFVSMQIKTVRLFVKYEHLNSGYPTNSYYMATHYPAPDRALKVGLTWIFNN